MGEKLLKYYKYIYDVKGIEGRIQLAMSTNMPTPKAAIAVDSEESINVFRNAIKKITGTEAPKY